MAQNSFSMHPQKPGRMKYLLLTVAPTLLLMQLFLYLTDSGILPRTRTLDQVYLYTPLALMAVLGYPLIFKKNHLIEVKDNTLIETDWRKKNVQTYKVPQLHSYRRNLLGEIILLDKQGGKLLCVETNMSNFDVFRQWLVRHDIFENKEK